LTNYFEDSFMISVAPQHRRLFIATATIAALAAVSAGVFGLRTLETMNAAGLRAAALEAGKVIVLEKPAVLAQAKAWGITLHGF